ncbi:MAG: TVP38/TMEM64 family protein [Thermodesulfobacterium geofontis]|uniref:TVP38/TMEM64 family membrane protein n=1 Tax=Thermodesulfobacterium geofontis TaxID=1295609 RepID=A0A2N7Q9C0_9BACT|nr:MAG: TVP38/TMEM64 family protein [Thermodesulfobacterium geofontis]
MLDSLLHLWNNREELRKFLGKHPYLGPFLFIIFQALQVVLAPVPGEATGFLAGFFFGAFKGCLISITGIVIGSSMAFYIGRYFKRKFLLKYEKSIFRKYGTTGVFFLYVFPGFPKDILNYLLGLMPISFKAFILICSIGRLPGTFALSLQGDVVYGGHPYKIFIVYGIFGIAFLIFFLFKKKIENWLYIDF